MHIKAAQVNTSQPIWPVLWKDKNLLIMSITLQLVLGLFFGHFYDMRIFMATGYLVASGQNPYIMHDLSGIFNNIVFQGMTTIGYPPPWALILGLIYKLSYSLTHNLLIYNLAIKIPIIAANLSLAYMTAGIIRKFGASEKVSQKALGTMLLSPFLLYFSSAWGQFDSIVALLALSALVLLVSGKTAGSALLLAASISFKPTAFPIFFAALFLLSGKSFLQTLKYFAVFLIGLALFCVIPFIILAWSPQPIFDNWNAHFSVAGGMSILTFFELLNNSYQLQGNWWLFGLIWLPALAAAILFKSQSIFGFEALLKKSTALILIFFLTRAWLSEPNLILAFPFILILASIGKLDPRLFNAIWIIPLVFTIFNGSLPQLFFPSMPGIMEKMIIGEEFFRTFRLIAKVIIVIPWQIAGWLIVGACYKNNTNPLEKNWN